MTNAHRHPARVKVTCTHCRQEFELTASVYKTRMRKVKYGLYCGMWCVAQASSEREEQKALARLKERGRK